MGKDSPSKPNFTWHTTSSGTRVWCEIDVGVWAKGTVFQVKRMKRSHCRVLLDNGKMIRVAYCNLMKSTPEL